MKNLQPKGRLFFKMHGSWIKTGYGSPCSTSLTSRESMHAYCMEYEKSSRSFFFDKR